jgi:hypothetical protein
MLMYRFNVWGVNVKFLWVEPMLIALPTLTPKYIARAYFLGFFGVCGALESNQVLHTLTELDLLVTCPVYLPSRLSGALFHPRLRPFHWLVFTFLAVLVGYSTRLFGYVQ